MELFIKQFSETGIADVAEVGVKNASLGEMYNNLGPKGIPVPNGFAVTVAAFRRFIAYNKLELPLLQALESLDRSSFNNLSHIGSRARALILNAKFPQDIENSIIQFYASVFGKRDQEVAVRSSIASDGIDTDFDGQYDSYLNIKGPVALVYAIKCCFASLYNDRAIKCREEKGLDHQNVFLSVGVQRMVRSDLGCSGICFTRKSDFETIDTVDITGMWGLGEYVVQDSITPDEFVVSKSLLIKNEPFIVKKTLGSKSRMLVYSDNAAGTNSTVDRTTPRELRVQFVLTDEEAEQLARWSVVMEKHYGSTVGFEWAKDGTEGKLYIIRLLHGKHAIDRYTK